MALCRQYFNQLQAIGDAAGGRRSYLVRGRLPQPAGRAAVRAANAYLFRYWLGGRFYFVSTNYTLEPRVHFAFARCRQRPPARRAVPPLCQKGSFPPLEKVHRLCCLPAAHPPLLRTLWVRLLARL